MQTQLAASRVSAAITAFETSTSSANQTWFAQHQIGSVLVAQTNPRLQAVVVAQHTTAARAPLLSLFQTRYGDRHAQEWVLPKLRDRYINRLPQQHHPPDHAFEDVSYVQQQVLSLVREDPANQLTENDLDFLIHQLPAQPSLPPPSPILVKTSSEISFSARHVQPSPPPSRLLPADNSANYSRKPTVKSTTALPLAFSHIPTANQQASPDLAKTLEALTQKIADIDLYVRSHHSGSRGRRVKASPLSLPASDHSRPPSVPGLPSVHPQLLMDASPRESFLSRSRPRSHSRNHHKSVRQYSKVYVPCPFQDSRQSMTPEARRLCASYIGISCGTSTLFINLLRGLQKTFFLRRKQQHIDLRLGKNNNY